MKNTILPTTSTNLINHQHEGNTHFSVIPWNHDWVQLIDSEQMWSLLEEQLYLLHHQDRLRICGFVMMPDHLRILSRSSPVAVLHGFEQIAKTLAIDVSALCGVSLLHSKNAGASPQILRSFEIPTSQHYLRAYRSLYRAPLLSGLCDSVQEFPFSTLSGLLGARHLLVPIEPDDILFTDVEGTLDWLNSLEDEW
jgi:hypothetical protein